MMEMERGSDGRPAVCTITEFWIMKSRQGYVRIRPEGRFYNRKGERGMLYSVWGS